MDSNIISTQGLIYDYPVKRALFGIDVAIKRGGITALVGPNGAGKTTLIRCLVALSAPTAGQVVFDGHDVAEAPRLAHRDMGYLPDFYGLYDDMSVRALLEHGAEMRGMTRRLARDRAHEAAGRLDIEDRLDHKVSSLSRGLAQRAAIARAIIHAPKFVVLDEPAAGLDPEARMRLSALFRRLQGDGMTLLVSSHILAELEDYCTDMIIIQGGQLVEDVTGEGLRPRRVSVELTGLDPRLDAILRAADGVDEVEIEGAAARFAFVGDNDALAGLLRRLVDAGLAVTRFAERAERFQDTYRRAVAGRDNGDGNGGRDGAA